MFFHEIYNTYYLAVERMIRQAASGMLDEKSAWEIARETAFSESFLYILDAVRSETWQVVTKDFRTPLQNLPKRPLTDLERQWVAAVKQDPRMRLFEPETAGTGAGAEPETDAEQGAESETAKRRKAEKGRTFPPLYSLNDFYITDAPGEGDPYGSQEYRAVFRMVLKAAEEGGPLRIRYVSGKGREREDIYLPLRLEYSEKDDRFRLLAQGRRGFTILNLSRIKECVPEKEAAGTDAAQEELLRRGRWKNRSRESAAGQGAGAIRKAAAGQKVGGAHLSEQGSAAGTFGRRRPGAGFARRKKKVVLELTDERNALERCMLHFADLEKRTEQAAHRCYRIEILYRAEDETEILIRVLSFGPFLKVTEPGSFVSLVKERLKKQIERDAARKG